MSAQRVVVGVLPLVQRLDRRRLVPFLVLLAKVLIVFEVQVVFESWVRYPQAHRRLRIVSLLANLLGCCLGLGCCR
jgi:hypothetical protein